MSIDKYAIVFYLTQACLGEITSNFNRIYLKFEGEKITVLFFLIEENDDVDSISEEIMFYFINFVDDNLSIELDVQYEVFFGINKFLKYENSGDLIQIFHMKELLE